MHAVENMFSASGITPWHKLGIVIPKDKQLSIAEGIEAAGLNWEVKKLPLQVCTKQSMLDGGVKQDIADTFDGAFEQFVDKFATVRMSDKSVLGVVGKNYEILQNVKAFEFFQPFLDSGECELESSGSLWSGQKVWVLAKINRPSGMVDSDQLNKYLLLSNSHDGSMAVRVGTTMVRVVCWNTMMASVNDKASKLIRIRHSSKMDENLQNIRESIDVINDEMNATIELYTKLCCKTINQNDLRKFVKLVLDVDTEKLDKDLPTRTQNTIDKIVGYHKNSPGVSGQNWYDAINAVTYYLSHDYGRSIESRYDSLWFGSSSDTMKKALNLAIQMSA